MNAQLHSVDLLSTLQSYGLPLALSSKSKTILKEVTSSGQISTNQIAGLFTSDKQRGASFESGLQLLIQACATCGIPIVYDIYQTKVREQYRFQNITPFTAKKEPAPHESQKIDFPQTQKVTERKRTPTKILRLENLKTTLTSQENFILTAEEPSTLVLPIGNIDNAVRDNEWYEHTLDESVDNSLEMYLREIKKYKLLSKDEEITLIIKAQNGDERAKNQFVCSNLRLVVWNAMKFRGRISDDNAVQFIDLIQEGNRGLMISVGKFDPNMGNKFSTYSTWWIRQSISRFIDDFSREVRIPVHMAEKIRKYRRVNSHLTAKLGFVSPNDIANEMQINVEEVLTLRAIATQGFVSVDGYRQDGDSEDAPVPFIADTEQNAYETLNEKQIKMTMRKVLKKNLTPKEYEIYVSRSGINGNEPETLEEIGKRFGVTRERIRQIEAKAMPKLRYSPELISLARSMNFKISPSIIETAKRILEEKKEVVVQETNFIKIIADFYEVDEIEIYVETQKKSVTRVQHMIIFLLRNIFKYSFPEIGIRLGGRNQIMVMHEYNKMKSVTASDSELKSEVRYFENLFRSIV